MPLTRHVLTARSISLGFRASSASLSNSPRPVADVSSTYRAASSSCAAYLLQLHHPCFFTLPSSPLFHWQPADRRTQATKKRPVNCRLKKNASGPYRPNTREWVTLCYFIARRVRPELTRK